MKKLKPYLLTSLITVSILLVIFMLKGIYPFGDNSLIWGDMHDQITAFYYHFYDSIKGNSSIFINFSTSGGINFFGILAYYILSPLSFLVLLVEREKIYLIVSVIIAFKILLCGLTCQYFIRYYFKKLPSLLSVLLAIIYAFSGYGLMMYQITPWIDAMYMLPLVMIGLKKVLDLEKPTMYITTLTLCLIFSFYVSIMVIGFIFLLSLIYLFVYKETKEERKKGVLALGISTVISILLSLVVVVPSYMQIAISSRMGSSIETLLNSKLGPITDKLSMFLFGGAMYLGILFLLKNYKKHKKFLTFYIPTLLLLLIPVIIEPINKVWHFGSYAFFPYRQGFITMFLLIVGACYGYEHYEEIKKINLKRNKLFSIIITLVVSASIFITTYMSYNDFQSTIETLTISINHWLIIVLILSTIASLIGCFIVLLLNKKLNNFSIILISIITITHIGVNSSIYLGMDKEQDILMSQYEELNEISKTYEDDNYYRVKNEATNMIMNSGMVMRYHTLDHFTSLTDQTNLETLKKLGYSSMWVKTYSKGGNLFLDSILANKYIMTRKELDSKYYELVDTYNNLNFYSHKQDLSYGYLMDYNDTIFNLDNSFQISNSIYQNITGKTDYIFEIVNDFNVDNMRISKKEDYTLYEIIDKDIYSYLRKNITINGEKSVYLEIAKSLNNSENYDMYEQFNIYVNGILLKQKAFSEIDNGVLDLGTYKDTEIDISIEFLNDLELSNVTIGIMDNKMYEDFITNYKLDTDISYNENHIKVNIEGKEDKILFLPIAYNEGYQATNNGKKVEIIKLYENFIGIKLVDGENKIDISFRPNGLIPSVIISLISLIVTIVLIKTNLYNKIINNKYLSNIAYYSYLTIYLLGVSAVYVGLTIVFIISYFKII